jgi:hypothetical protein
MIVAATAVRSEYSGICLKDEDADIFAAATMPPRLKGTTAPWTQMRY